MTTEYDQPNPDEILKAIQKQEKRNELGRLKIFFGMSAGVGKTYSMLEEAQRKLKEGVDIVVGIINTHSRKETEALLVGLTIIPEKWINYKDSVFEEMDLETIIHTKPQIVLVDELAHTNVPGSKHPKRWQDVIEILDAGIDVYTTLNVQHVESRKNIVESLTGIHIRETVPDLILERATSIELIDIPPPELLQRLNEGKVYLGLQSKIAAENFFQEENLMALREIALRFTAEKVDHDLHGMVQGRGWKTRERLMVALSSSPSSEDLLRATRRLAFELDAPWIAVYVDTGVTLKDQDQARLNRYFNLARELGAEAITTHDLNIADGLQRIARQRDITRIVIGRPPKKKTTLWNLFQSNFIERLENENKQLDIIVLRQEKYLESSYSPATSQITKSSQSYGISALSIVAITLMGFLTLPLIGYKSVGFIFLLGILALSLFLSRGPIFFAALLSAICWYYFFIPFPFNPEDITLTVIYFLVAVTVGTMSSRIHEQDKFLHRREETIEKLYEIERDITNSTNLQQLRLNVGSRLENSFPGKFDILIKSPNDQLILDSQIPLLSTEKEKAAAIWVFQNGKIGGWSTDTLPSAEGIYFPIKFAKTTVGVLIYYPKRTLPFSSDEMNFFQTVTQHLGVYLERYIFEEHISKMDYSRQIERMHHSIFHSLNRSFYSPLEKIIRINQQIQKESLDPHIHALSEQMGHFISNIKLTVDNIIAISELESGFIPFDRKQYPVKDLVERTLSDVKAFVNGHKIYTDIPLQPPLFPFDFNLLRLALNNLILNAIEYSDPNKPIYIKLEVLENEFCLSVVDEGAGIGEEVLSVIFDKFYRASDKSKGLGLGLAIVKAVVDIHKGKIEVKNNEGKGTKFSIILPI